MNNNTEQLVFVYGTLKQQYGNHVYLGDSEFLGEAETPPHYTLFDGSFPIVERGGNTSIKGEVYKVTNPKNLSMVYRLEGYSGTPSKNGGSNWYDVDKIQTPYGEAEIFVMDKGKSLRSKIVDSGIWTR